MSPNFKRSHSELSDSECNGNLESIKRQSVDHDDSGMSDGEISVIDEQIVEGHIDNAQWQTTISKVVSSVVSIHFSQVAPFDCDSALVSEALSLIHI